LFTYFEASRNDLLREQELEARKVQAAQDQATRDHQARLAELQTLAPLMPYLTRKDEYAKQVAITMIKAYTKDVALAVELASLNKSPGTVQAVRQIATNSTSESDRKVAQAALVELEKASTGPNLTLLRTEQGDCGPAGKGGDKATNLLKNRTDVPSVARDMTIDAMTQLEIPEVARQRDKWDPAQTAAIKSIGEGQAVRIHGFLVRVKNERGTTADCEFANYGDWHLAIAPSSENEKGDFVLAVAGPRIRLLHSNWSLPRLQALAESKSPVRVTGWLFFDQQHPTQGPLKIASTPWEIRPAVKIEFQLDGSWHDLDEAMPQNSANGKNP